MPTLHESSVDQERGVDPVCPGDDTALQVCRIGESCVLEECENLGGSDTGLAVFEFRCT